MIRTGHSTDVPVARDSSSRTSRFCSWWISSPLTKSPSASAVSSGGGIGAERVSTTETTWITAWCTRARLSAIRAAATAHGEPSVASSTARPVRSSGRLARLAAVSTRSVRCFCCSDEAVKSAWAVDMRHLCRSDVVVDVRLASRPVSRRQAISDGSSHPAAPSSRRPQESDEDQRAPHRRPPHGSSP